MTTRFATVGVLLTAVALLPVTLWAQKGDLTHEHPATPSAEVGFGVLAFTPIGPPPCVQVTVPGGDAIGGPTDPCAYKLHHLEPEEVTIFKGGAVTFQVHGGGHGMAIYEVSKDTTRDEIGQFLCPGMDPSELPNLLDHRCRLTAFGGIGTANAAAEFGTSATTSTLSVSIQPRARFAAMSALFWWSPVMISIDAPATLLPNSSAASRAATTEPSPLMSE